MSEKKLIFKNISFAVIGRIVRILSSLIIGVFLARFLGPDDYGLLQYVISIVTICQIFSDFGLPSIFVKEFSKEKFTIHEILGTGIYIRTVLAILTIGIIAIISFKEDAETRLYILIYSTLVLSNIFSPIQNYFTAVLRNEFIVRAELYKAVVGGIIKIILIIVKAPLQYIVIAFSFDFFLYNSYLVLSYTRKAGSISLVFNKKLARYLLNQSYPLLISGIAIVIYSEIDKVMINYYLDSKSVGVYSAAVKIVGTIVFVPQVIAQTIVPILIRKKSENTDSYHKMSQKFMDCIVWGALIVSSLMCISSSYVIPALYGQAYIAAIPVLYILSWKGLASSLLSASGQLIIIEDLQKLALIRNFAGALINVTLNMVLIPKFGILGAAVATIISFFISGFLIHIVIKPFRFIFDIQIKALIFGASNLIDYTKSFLNKNA